MKRIFECKSPTCSHSMLADW